jgi:hypothetical protein
MKFKEVNGKDMIDDLFSTRDKQLEEEKKPDHVENSNQQGNKSKSDKVKKERKPRTPKKKN